MHIHEKISWTRCTSPKESNFQTWCTPPKKNFLNLIPISKKKFWTLCISPMRKKDSDAHLHKKIVNLVHISTVVLFLELPNIFKEKTLNLNHVSKGIKYLDLVHITKRNKILDFVYISKRNVLSQVHISQKKILDLGHILKEIFFYMGHIFKGNFFIYNAHLL